MENFIYQYYVEPIWNHSGYNIVNTLTYAIIAIIAIYLIYRLIKTKIEINRNFMEGTLAFVLFGSTLRVVTDSVDGGVFTPITPIHSLLIENHVYDYGYLTVSPGIYVLTAVLFLASLLICHKRKRMDQLKYFGLGLFLPHMLLLLPLMKYAIYAIPVIILAAIPAYLAYRYFKESYLAGIVGAHALDGAATFFVIDIFSGISGIIYSEQHVIPSLIGSGTGTYFIFFLVKVAIAAGAAYVIQKEKLELNEKYYLAVVLMIMGLAPGLRDILRMMVGT